MDALDELIARLEHAAAELRTGAREPGRAAGLVDDGARLAGEASAELDRRVRVAEAEAPSAGQLALEP